MGRAVSTDRLDRLSAELAGRMGIELPPEKSAEMLQKLRLVAKDLEIENLESCVDRLTDIEWTREQARVMARYFTIGETYFFRHENDFKALEELIIPGILQAGAGSTPRLRIWSAGCSSGEEPYSIAMFLDSRFPASRAWDVSILATDINPAALDKAKKGIYTEWSFRNTPDNVRQSYFKKLKKDRFLLEPRIRKRVFFSELNLSSEEACRTFFAHEKMDVIFCRNVLMYFTPETFDRVIQFYHDVLTDDGWLILTASEAPFISNEQFEHQVFDGAVLFHKKSPDEVRVPDIPQYEAPRFRPRALPSRKMRIKTDADASASLQIQLEKRQVKKIDPLPVETEVDPLKEAESLFERGLLKDAAALLDKMLPEEFDSGAEGADEASVVVMLARAAADQGALEKSIAWCAKGADTNKLNPSFHYFHGTVLQEAGDWGEAVRAYNRVLYLDPDHVMTHFILGTQARQTGVKLDSERHLENALSILERYSQDEIVDESGGITARRLQQMIREMLNGKVTA